MVFLRHSVLALKVLRWVLLASLAVFALATAFGVAHERKQALEEAHADAKDAANRSLSAISNSLWQFDVASLNALLTGMVASKVVVRAEVLAFDKILAEVSQPGFSGSTDRVWTLPVLAQDHKTVIGTLRISESYAQANAQIDETLKILVMTDLVKIIALAFVLFVIVYRNIASPLRQLARDVTQLGQSDDPPQLYVARKSRGRDHDEIDILVDTINRFVSERNQEMHRRATAERQRGSAELALAQSEENLAITLQSIGDAVMATDANGNITRMNPTAERLTGWSLGDAVGQSLAVVFHIIHAVTRQVVDDPVQRVMEQGQVVGLENHTVLLSKDGREYQVADSAAPIRNASGTIVGVVLVFSDVTEKYLAQEALEESRERYRALSEAAFEAIFISEKGVCLEQNSQAQLMFGYTLSEAIGRMGTDWIAPSDRDQVIRHMMSGYEQPYEVTGLRKDGSTFPAVIRARMMHYRNRDVRVTSMRDITERKQAQERVLESEVRYRTLIEWSPSAIGVHCAGTLLYANAAAIKLFGAASGQNLVGTPVLDRVHPQYREAVSERIENFIETGLPAPLVRSKFLKMDGTAIDVEVQGTPIVFDGKKSTLFALHDITESQRASAELRIAATAFDSQQGMTITDSQRVILRVNKAFSAITGYSADEAVGQTPRMLSSGRHDRAFYVAMTAALENEGAWAGEIWNRRKSGEVYPEWLTISAVKDVAGLTTHYVAIFSDVSERFKAQSQIDTLAFYDPLTQLPNRRLLLDRLDQALHVSTRHARQSALLFVDLDNFKTLNDTQGHFQGDSLLVQVAQRLKTCIREGDTVARLGSDEFVVMLEDLSEDVIEAATQAETVGHKILGTFLLDFLIDNCAYHGTASIGITLFGGNAQEGSEQPLKRAELAMFQGKAAGRNALRFFDAKMQAEVSSRAALEADLREAVHKQQFILHYQPQVVGAGRITGVEALVRWLHPGRGLVSPAEFIPLAEECGLILQLGQWVLDAACSQLAAWAAIPGLGHLTMAVNVSARQFQQTDFVDSVQATLARTGAKPKLLKLELTESMLVDDVEGIIEKMSALKAKGVSFSLDDFGTGYSSLSYLKRLPLGQLKIDQGFVRNIVTDTNDAAIGKMVVALAESLGLAVIAEGVELQAQADFLAHMGCHAYQGYLFSRPLPVAEFHAFAVPGRDRS
jgi:diguanylate cyclase (GGDEF)-like protein/PAS domain S-box-containing protein